MSIRHRRALTAVATTAWAALAAVLTVTEATHLAIGVAAAAVALTLTAVLAWLLSPMVNTARLFYTIGRDER